MHGPVGEANEGAQPEGGENAEADAHQGHEAQEGLEGWIHVTYSQTRLLRTLWDHQYLLANLDIVITVKVYVVK